MVTILYFCSTEQIFPTTTLLLTLINSLKTVTKISSFFFNDQPANSIQNLTGLYLSCSAVYVSLITEEGNSLTVRADLAPSNTPGAGYLHHSIVKSHSHASVLSPHPKTLGRVEKGKEIPSPTAPY